MIVERRYKPEDYDADTLGKSMLEAYELAEKEDPCLFSAVEDVYYFAKEAVKFREITPEQGKEIQEFFWGLLP